MAAQRLEMWLQNPKVCSGSEKGEVMSCVNECVASHLCRAFCSDVISDIFIVCGISIITSREMCFILLPDCKTIVHIDR